jgi:hypothetical protein
MVTYLILLLVSLAFAADCPEGKTGLDCDTS